MHIAAKIGLVLLTLSAAFFGGLYVMASMSPANSSVNLITNPDGSKHFIVDIHENVGTADSLG